MAYVNNTRKTVESTGPCTWLVERRNPLFDLPPEAEWYPDSPADVYVVAECGADARYFVGGGFECDAGHALGSLEEELAPGGYEWQREQEERWS